jgi:hypothetical protein
MLPVLNKHHNLKIMKISLSKIYIIQRIISQRTLVSTHQVCILGSLIGACTQILYFFNHIYFIILSGTNEGE